LNNNSLMLEDYQISFFIREDLDRFPSCKFLQRRKEQERHKILISGFLEGIITKKIVKKGVENELAGIISYDISDRELIVLWIDPKHRRKGLSFVLLDSVDRIDFVYVRKSNNIARYIYKKIGLSIQKEHEDDKKFLILKRPKNYG